MSEDKKSAIDRLVAKFSKPSVSHATIDRNLAAQLIEEIAQMQESVEEQVSEVSSGSAENLSITDRLVLAVIPSLVSRSEDWMEITKLVTDAYAGVDGALRARENPVVDTKDKTLVLLKPDCVKRGLIGKAISHFEDHCWFAGICNFRILWLTRAHVELLYEKYINEEFFNDLVDFMVSGPSVAIVIKANNIPDIVQRIRDSALIFRKKFATDLRHNVIHASDSDEAAHTEINIFF